jgi:hypothetical protein
MGQNITYTPRGAIKSQVLTDFVAEWTEIQTPLASIEHETWIMYFNGSVMKEGAGVGLLHLTSWCAHGVLGTTTLPGIEQHRQGRNPDQ